MKIRDNVLYLSNAVQIVTRSTKSFYFCHAVTLAYTYSFIEALIILQSLYIGSNTYGVNQAYVTRDKNDAHRTGAGFCSKEIYINVIHYRQKLWNVPKGQWIHSFFTFQFDGNGLAPTTNKYCDLCVGL